MGMKKPDFRAELEALLPDGARLRVDRTGRALFAEIPAHPAPEPLLSRGWRWQTIGNASLISPGTAQLQALRAAAPPREETRSFRDRPPDPDVLPLFTALLRACELPPQPAERSALEKRLRQQMAAGLRTRGGGGLEVCAALFEFL